MSINIRYNAYDEHDDEHGSIHDIDNDMVVIH